MPSTHAHHRLPRAGLDPIDDAASAFATIALAVHRPLRDETIVLALDESRCGSAIVIVSGTDRPDDVLDVVECITQGVHGEQLGSIVVASVRSRRESSDGRDIDRWLEMSDIAALAGIELLEWFVVADSITCPRDALGEAPRW